jgi:hypothetical protein
MHVTQPFGNRWLSFGLTSVFLGGGFNMRSSRSLVCALALCFCLIAITSFPITISAQEKATSTSSVSQQDKVKDCNNLADKKNLNSDDRKNFVKSCMEKVNGTQPVSEMSEKDKMNACKNLADKQNLKGDDRKSFLKDCMKKANNK